MPGSRRRRVSARDSVEDGCEGLPQPAALRSSECGCPLAALAPELARADETMKVQILGELTKYKDRMLPFMPGRRVADKERNFVVIFSTMIGAISIARMLPDPAARAIVLATAQDFLLRSFRRDKHAA